MTDTEPDSASLIKLARIMPEGTTDLLAMILDHQAAEADHWDRLRQSYADQTIAQLWAVTDGVRAALERCEPLGTTREYEHFRRAVARALREAHTTWGYRVGQFYLDEIARLRSEGATHIDAGTPHRVWPGYDTTNDYGRVRYA